MKRLLPSYPLWIIDPNFSVWSKTNTLNGGDTVFWTGISHKAYGLVRYNGKTYCFMGRRDDVEFLNQIDIQISAFGTRYTFECDEFTLIAEFVSPRIPTDIRIMSCPICYTMCEVNPKNGRMPEDFSIAVALAEDFCYNSERAPVTGGVLPLNEFEAAFITRQRNLVLSNTSDTDAPEHGSTYITGKESFFITETAFNRYIQNGDMKYSRIENESNFIVGINKTAKSCFITAFDDFVSIFYFGDWLKGYFFKDGYTIVDAMQFAYKSLSDILNNCREFDSKLKTDCDKIGQDYYILTCAALRQSIGAHKLVENRKGELLFLSKECNSNGCIGTVDISYPSMPLFLLYNPELVNAMMTGIYEFARMPVWTYDFAPHDLGVYPWCAGQVYGVNESDDKYGCRENFVWRFPQTIQMLYLRPAKRNVYSTERQMPVEECGNMLIMTAAALCAGASNVLAQKNFDLLKIWVTYLEKFGLKPESQLCTDDFAGHLANNVNLAIKALVGIEAFSIICKLLDKKDLADEYKEKAEIFAKELKLLVDGDVMPLAYGQDGTYSLKYNILFDKLFGWNLIGQEVCEREVDYYIDKSNRYGVPLDTRKDYTKSDWILWCAALTDNKEKCEKLYYPIVRFLTESPSREPFIDWYGTEKGEYIMFRNRTVQGGIFAPLLRIKGFSQGDR